MPRIPLKINNFKIKKTSRKKLLRISQLLLLLLVLIVSYLLLPVDGKIVILTNNTQGYVGVWPQIKIEPIAAKQGEKANLTITDTTAWTGVELFVEGIQAQLVDSKLNSGSVSSWKWSFVVPQGSGYTAVFYHNCETGCSEITGFTVGKPDKSNLATPIPTKLGLVFADPTRNWHNRAGWDVELVYTQLPNDPDFSFDVLAQHVQQATKAGLRVLVRVDYDKNQSLPPEGDEDGVAHYLVACARLVHDDRLKDVYGYIIGSSFNKISSNSLAPSHPVTPKWYTRIFEGFGLDINRTDNVLQKMRAINPSVRVLVGPVTPWTSDQNGPITDPLDVPWINYMNSMIADLDKESRAKQEVGFALTVPDGFAVQASGRAEAVSQPAQEPHIDIHNTAWSDAQMGFRVYKDWLAIINRYPATHNLPVYITSTNTYTSDSQIDPSQNYPAGWLSNAVNEINGETQIQAFCWFLDLPYDKWANFSLKTQIRNLKTAASEFDQLLQK